MSPEFKEIIDRSAESGFNQYATSLQINQEWISLRSADFPPNSTAPWDGRFHETGVVAYYAASGKRSALAAVYGDPNYSGAIDRKAYAIPSGNYNVFDLKRFSADFGIEQVVTLPKDQGGWELTKYLAERLQDHGFTGILYQSAAMQNFGSEGNCLVLLPSGNSQVKEDYFKEIKF